MIKMEDYKPPCYCVNCGTLLQGNEAFCTICGARTDKGTSNSATEKKKDTLLVPSILIVLWAGFALLVGLVMLIAADIVAEEMESVWPQIVDLIVFLGIILTVSGIMAVIALVCIILKKFYVIALIACMASATIALCVIIGIIGFVSVYLIYKGKDNFTTT